MRDKLLLAVVYIALVGGVAAVIQAPQSRLITAGLEIIMLASGEHANAGLLGHYRP